MIDMVCFAPAEAESAVRALRGQTAQYVFCSTVDVYQRPAISYPYREDHPQQPRSAYASGKMQSESVFRRAHEEKAFQLTIVRPGFTTGEGGLIVHTFARNTGYLDRLRKGKPVVVHGDGSGFWTASHRDELARQLLLPPATAVRSARPTISPARSG